MTAPSLLTLLLPSVTALGIWIYWALGAAALVEAFLVTGLFLPGWVLVDLGGVLVQRGVLSLADVVWFAATGSWIGSWLSFRLGRRAGRLGRGPALQRAAALDRAAGLLARRGAWAVVLGRFSGAVAGLVPFAAGRAGMGEGRFLALSAAGALPWALAHVALGHAAAEVFGRLSPALSREVVAVGALLFLLAVLWHAVARLGRALPWVIAMLAAVLRGLARQPGVQRWRRAHPRLVAWGLARLSRRRVTGLMLSVTLALLLGLGLAWTDSVTDFLAGGPILKADRNIASFLHSAQSPAGLRLATDLTAAGDWRAALALLAAAVLALVCRGQGAFALGLTLAVLGQAATVAALKPLFGRARPALAHFSESGASFPSGQAALAVALVGGLGYAAWRLGWGRLVPLAAAVILAMAFSRLYLGAHYLSDVLNGLLVGAIWAVIGMALAEALRASRLPPHPPWPPLARATPLLPLALAALVILSYDKPLAPSPPESPPVTLARAGDLPLQPGFDPFAESLIGSEVEPVSILLIAPDQAAVVAAFTRAGWSQPAPADLGRLAEAALAAWTNRPDPVGPITPYFRDGRPNDLAFQKPDATDSLRRRHHLRLWQTGARLPDGQALFLATASFDDGLKWGLVHHIAPDLDQERDTVLADLAAAGVLAPAGDIAGPGPLTGKDEFGDPWHWDGRIRMAQVLP